MDLNENNIIELLSSLLPEGTLTQDTIKEYMKPGKLNEIINKSLEGKSLKEKKKVQHDFSKMKNMMKSIQNKKYCILINSSKKIKRIIINNEDVYISPKTKETIKTNLKLLGGISEPLEDLESEILNSISLEETEIYASYDKNSKKFNKLASDIIGFPVGGNVIFFNNKYDLNLKDVDRT